MSTIFRFGLLASLAAVPCFALSFAMSSSAAARPRQGEPPANAEEPAPPEAPLFFVISLSKQQVSAYSPEGLYAQSPVSTGQPGHPTPQGIFTILGKELYHRSTIYSGAPMPFMQRSHCTRESCPAIRPPTAALGCPTSLPSGCSE